MTLSPIQLNRATRLQKQGHLLREIAGDLGVAFEDVCLALYGNNDWKPRLGAADISGGENGGVDAADVGGAAADAAGRTVAPVTDPAVSAAPDYTGGADAGAEPQDAPAAAAATGPAAEPVAAPAPEGRAAAAPSLVVDGLDTEPLRVAEPRVPAAALSTVAAAPDAAGGASSPHAGGLVDDGRWYRLVEFDGQSLHQNRRVLTRRPEFFWLGTADAVRRLKRSMPQWQDLEPVEVKS